MAAGRGSGATAGRDRYRDSDDRGGSAGRARWGRGTETPMFEFGVSMKEVPAKILKEAMAEAKSLA